MLLFRYTSEMLQKFRVQAEPLKPGPSRVVSKLEVISTMTTYRKNLIYFDAKSSATKASANFADP
jgi:hypothetical protein